MNIVIILFKTNPQILQFHFDKYADAQKAQKRVVAEGVIEDDYGSAATITTSEILSTSITDVQREMLAQEEVELHKHRKDVRVNRTMNTEQSKGIVQPPMRMQS